MGDEQYHGSTGGATSRIVAHNAQTPPSEWERVFLGAVG